MDEKEGDIKKLEREYRAKCSLYERFCEAIVIQLDELFSLHKIPVSVQIEYRVKEWKSILDNIEKYKAMPKALNEINDLAGIRIVLIFRRDVDKVCKIVEKVFKILDKEDKSKGLAENKFGYGSIHYNLQLPKRWYSLPTMNTLKNLQAELQIRTASQHIWAVVSHYLQYKNENDVPISLQRSINRVAALLETVDNDFEQVLIERDKYQKRTKNKLSKKETLNTDLLAEVLNKLFPKENKSEHEAYASLLEDLRAFNINNAEQLEHIITKHLDKVIEYEKKTVELRSNEIKEGKRLLSKITCERIQRGVFFTHIGLTRRTLRAEFGDKFSAYRTQKIKTGIEQRRK